MPIWLIVVLVVVGSVGGGIWAAIKSRQGETVAELPPVEPQPDQPQAE